MRVGFSVSVDGRCTLPNGNRTSGVFWAHPAPPRGFDVEVLWDVGWPTQVRRGEVIGKVVREAQVWVENDVIPSLIPLLLEAMFGPGE